MDNESSIPIVSPERLLELICLLRDQRISLAELADMEQAVIRDRKARSIYVRMMALQASLAWMAPKTHVAEPSTSLPSTSLPWELSTLQFQSAFGWLKARIRRPRLKPWTLVLPAVLILIALSTVLWGGRLFGPGKPQPVASLSAVSGVLQGNGAPIALGAALVPQRLTLAKGMAELTFTKGATALLEAPIDLELINDATAYLHIGRLVMRVPAGSAPYVIDTKRGTLRDLATEFGVGVNDDGETVVQVFDGALTANGISRSDPIVRARRVAAGHAVQLPPDQDSELKDVSFAPNRFIRRMPTPPQSDYVIANSDATPQNVVHVDSITVQRATTQLVIDGDLTDWILEGGFNSKAKAPYTEHYQVFGHMMYDSNYLYIGARVKDPEPMRSVIDPVADPSIGWKGGSVQVRLCSDAKLGWPLTGETTWVRNKTPLLKDISRNLVHLTMWHYRPAAKPCLRLEYGMDLSQPVTNPAGYHGAFQQDPDGLGYTVEYAIPWSLLNTLGRAPKAGDVLGACWNVHWSDHGGRLWSGYVVDVLNPSEPKPSDLQDDKTYARAATWGRALYK